MEKSDMKYNDFEAFYFEYVGNNDDSINNQISIECCIGIMNGELNKWLWSREDELDKLKIIVKNYLRLKKLKRLI